MKHEATNYTTYTCDICSKIVESRDSKAMVKKSMISHLALQHHELRPILEKDSRIDKGMVMLVSRFEKLVPIDISYNHLLFLQISLRKFIVL